MLEESTESINKLKLNKSPVKDGLNVELYPNYFNKIYPITWFDNKTPTDIIV